MPGQPSQAAGTFILLARTPSMSSFVKRQFMDAYRRRVVTSKEVHMHPQRLASSRVALLVALLVALVLSFGVAAPAWAAPRPPARAAVPAMASVALTGKVTLPETSIDGPGLASVGTTSVIAWTGTDAAHHLNVEISTDGLHFDLRTKLTLNETSPFRPDVTLLTENLPISVAWTGTDANHSLNLIFGVYQRGGEKLTLFDDNSFIAPAILQGASGPNGNTLYLAWTGTDTNHSLNFLPITEHGGAFTLGTKQTLSEFSSDAGPHLVRAGSETVALCWTSRSGQPKAAIANTTDLKFGSIATLTGQTSAFAPDAFFNVAVQGPPVWISWTGTDAAHHLNLEQTTTYPNFPNTKTILDELALGGPALAFNAGNQIAWTGTDASHHLNIAKFT